MTTLTEDAFLSKATAFLSERFGTEFDDFTPDAELIDSGRLDSLAILEFYLFLEECHGRAIPAEEANLSDLGTLRRAYGLLARLA